MRLDLTRRLALGWLAVVWLGCTGAERDQRPSVLLVVVDTLRADAVSAYGAVEGTTPHIDALAGEGVVYTRASAPSPWTLPSHASLFTGVGIEAHGVGVRGRMALPEGHATLAEAMRDAGYQTVGFAENPLISEAFGLTRGFDRFCALSVQEALKELLLQTGRSCDVVDQFARFVAHDASRPFFAFVNLYDPHAPYVDRGQNHFVRPDVPMQWTPRELEATPYRLCGAIPTARDLAALRGLYLGDVAAADEKVGQLVESARSASGDRPLIVVVTSDHGELFGERRLLDHEFTVSEAALHIPLVVAGLDGVAAGRIETPVTLADVPGSIRRWTGVDPPEGESGAVPVLPTRPDADARPRDLIAFYSDALLQTPAVFGEGVAAHPEVNAHKRSACGGADRVFGDMLSVTRWPHKLVFYDRYAPPELYDLSWDPHERSDQHALQPALAAPLVEIARRWMQEHSGAEAADLTIPSDAELEALRGLGYLEPEADSPR